MTLKISTVLEELILTEQGTIGRKTKIGTEKNFISKYTSVTKGQCVNDAW